MVEQAVNKAPAAGVVMDDFFHGQLGRSRPPGIEASGQSDVAKVRHSPWTVCRGGRQRVYSS